MKKILILICIVFIQKVYAQSDYREGFVILKNGDTISGFINYRITDSQFKKIEFKKTLESKKTEYTPLLIKAYGYKKNELFNSKKIKDSNYDDTFFLETLVSGKITLFRLYDDFYIEKDNPYIALRMIAMAGEDYGRSFVEEYIGDLTTLENLQGSINDISKIASDLIYLVNPLSNTDIQDLIDAPNGGFIQGNPADVQALQVNKVSDLTYMDSISSINLVDIENDINTLTIKIKEVEEQTNLNTIYEEKEKWLTRVYNDYSISKESYSSKDYGDYLIIKYGFIWNKVSYTVSEVVYLYNGKSYVLQYSSWNKYYSKYLPDVLKMIESFRITE